MKAQMAGKKTADKAVGRTKGGWNTKLHAVVDGLGNPVEFLLSKVKKNLSHPKASAMSMAFCESVWL